MQRSGHVGRQPGQRHHADSRVHHQIVQTVLDGGRDLRQLRDAVAAGDRTYPIQALAVSVGHRQPIGVGAGGVAMLAAMSKKEASELIWSNQDRLPQYRGLSAQGLDRLVTAARERGYSVIGNYAVSGVIGVGIALRGVDGEIVGGLSVASIEKRMTPARQETVARIMRTQMDSFEPNAAP